MISKVSSVNIQNTRSLNLNLSPLVQMGKHSVKFGANGEGMYITPIFLERSEQEDCSIGLKYLKII